MWREVSPVAKLLLFSHLCQCLTATPQLVGRFSINTVHSLCHVRSSGYNLVLERQTFNSACTAIKHSTRTILNKSVAQNQTLEKNFHKKFLEILCAIFPAKVNTCLLLIEIIRAIDTCFSRNSFWEFSKIDWITSGRSLSSNYGSKQVYQLSMNTRRVLDQHRILAHRQLQDRTPGKSPLKFDVLG
jgi:hypothetical protein